MDFFTWIVGTLAERYGWSYKDICYEMYFEEVWEMFVLASNMKAEDKNEYYKFHYLLVADKDGAKNWRDMQIPYPRPGSVKKMKAGGIDQLPNHIKVGRRSAVKGKQTK